MRKKSLHLLLGKYSSGWVSLSPDYNKIIAWSRTLPSLLAKLKKLNNPKGVMMNVEQDYSQYAG